MDRRSTPKNNCSKDAKRRKMMQGNERYFFDARLESRRISHGNGMV
jgi:hypothetical protein